MSVAFNVAPILSGRLSRSIAKVARTALALAGLALVVAGVVFVRTFAFEYFHGDPTAVQALMRAIAENQEQNMSVMVEKLAEEPPLAAIDAGTH
jgi:uncharacterized protein YjeT (DUF2065 family)